MNLFWILAFSSSVEGWKDVLRKFSKNDLERMSFKVTVKRLREMGPKRQLGKSADENFYRNCFNDSKFPLKKGRKYFTVRTRRYADGNDQNAYWLCKDDTCMKFCKRPYTILGDKTGEMMTQNICHKDVTKNGDTGTTFHWSRGIEDFPKCQKCQNFERDSLDRNLEMECVPDKMVRYRQSCKVKCKEGQTLFVNGSRQSQIHEPVEMRCKCEDDLCQNIGWKIFNPEKQKSKNGIFMERHEPIISQKDLVCLPNSRSRNRGQSEVMHGQK